jgi:hypothetical protein
MGSVRFHNFPRRPREREDPYRGFCPLVSVVAAIFTITKIGGYGSRRSPGRPSWVSDSPVKQQKTEIRIPATRKHARAVAFVTSSEGEGAGNAGRLGSPAASHAQKKAYELQSPQVRRTSRHSLRDGFTASFVLSPGIGLFCPRRWRDHRLASLMPASRHQDHTTSPYAPVRLVSTHRYVHRIPRPTFVTIAKRPS